MVGIFEFATKRCATEPRARTPPDGQCARRSNRSAMPRMLFCESRSMLCYRRGVPLRRRGRIASAICLRTIASRGPASCPDRIDIDDDVTFERIQNTYAAAVATLDVSLGKAAGGLHKTWLGRRRLVDSDGEPRIPARRTWGGRISQRRRSRRTGSPAVTAAIAGRRSWRIASERFHATSRYRGDAAGTVRVAGLGDRQLLWSEFDGIGRFC